MSIDVFYIIFFSLFQVPANPAHQSEPSFVTSGGKTFKVSSDGEYVDIGDFQLKIIGEISKEKLCQSDAERVRGGQWICNCTCLLAGDLVTRSVQINLKYSMTMNIIYFGL